MEQNGKAILIRELIREVEDKFGTELKSSKDFRIFAERMPRQAPVSMSTLKRLWQYVPNKHTPRDATLTILARTVGYADWHDFTAKHRDVSESGFLSGVDVRKDVPVGAQVELRWSPDRRCVVRKTGADGFVVVESVNAKLRAGDSFRTQRLEVGQPLMATRLVREGRPMPDYIAGRKNGLTEVRVVSMP